MVQLDSRVCDDGNRAWCFVRLAMVIVDSEAASTNAGLSRIKRSDHASHAVSANGIATGG
jgi:hypothetical protein